MHAPSGSTPASTLPAFLLAFVLLSALAAAGWWMVIYVRIAPSTPVPAQALNAGKHRVLGEPRLPHQPEAGPPWTALTTAQKEALYPLADRWSVLSEVQKRNWLNLAAGFHALSPEEQQKMLARITELTEAGVSVRLCGQALTGRRSPAARCCPRCRSSSRP